MKSIILIHHDGSRHLAFITPSSFDTQAWAEQRRAALTFLQVIRITEEYAQ